jgi:UDP-glucose 4-epimerase
MRYLITGGAGFIGSHLSEHLLKLGNEVFIIDDLSTGSIENIEHLREDKRFHVYIDSITNVRLLAEVVDRCDTVMHLAAAVGVQLVIDNPIKTIHTNVAGTELVLRQANKKKKKVMIASTSEVYGKSSKVPFGEEDDLVLGPPTKGRWRYACSKALDEFLALAYWYEKKLPVVIFRLFNTVGPRQTGRYGMVLPRLIKQAVSGSPLTVYGDGKQTRCFTYVDEVCNILAKLAENEKAIGEIYNIGSQDEISIDELAQKVKAVAASNSAIQYIPFEQVYGKDFEDFPRRVPDTRKIYELLGIRPQMTIDEILQRMIEFTARE